MASSQVSQTSVNADYLNEIEAARRDLRAIITSKQCAPIMLTLAWHDALTYDAKTNTGGPNGSIRRKQELQHKQNTHLQTAVDLCETVKKKHPKITYADLYQLAGVVAVEATGGPTIDFIPGRNDSNKSPEEGRLPDANQGAEQQRQVFYRMGLSDKDIVAFSGGNIVANATATTAASEPLKFDNSYFTRIIKAESDGSLKLSKHKAFVEDPVFWHYVQLYAKDEEAYFRDYAETHKKLSELGFMAPLSCKNVTEKWLMGVALVCCVMVFVRLCEIWTRVG